MPLSLRWVGAEHAPRVADIRTRCYGHGVRDHERYLQRTVDDTRITADDYVLAELDGQAVGTATGLSMTMWVRGGSFSCQGVAYVGAAKTHRRKRYALSDGRRAGVASAVMRATLDKARDRGNVLTALMPFRASFYEHFGYGVVERRIEWTIPLSLLPQEDFDSVRLFRHDDLPALMACDDRIAQVGQCDFTRTRQVWDYYLGMADEGFTVVDAAPGGSIHGWATFLHVHEGGKDTARVSDIGYDSPASLRRLLSMLGSLRDQYAYTAITLPVDLPLQWLLGERQVPHRPVNHAVASPRLYTRMQVRVLDHRRLLEAIAWPVTARGVVTVGIRESEGHECRLRIDVSDGRATVGSAAGEPNFSCTDVTWAAVALGELGATQAVTWSLASATPNAASLLDALQQGPGPFTGEYF